MRDAGGEIIYIGKANNLAKRVAHYFNPSRGPAAMKTSILAPLIRKIDYIPCASEREALLLERKLVRQYRPFFNVSLKDDKSYPYVKVSLGEDFPRVFLTRSKTADGGYSFGPFPKVAPVRALLTYLWRHRYFPLRPCRWDFGLERPLDPKKINSCIYYHTGECPAPCAGLITLEDYRAYAQRMVLFFQGRYVELQETFQAEMKSASARLDYERAAQLRDNIQALSQMGQRVRVQAIRMEDLSGALAGSQSVTDLQQALALSTPPFHIECFDISHFQGRQTVGSMVCFQGGQPHKQHYRKFKVREVAGIDDFKAMREVVGRRYRRLKQDNEALPDLVLIDGGKGQLGAALDALREIKVKIPLAALAKRVEEVFLPGRAESILLEPSRPALRLLQHLRNEAHRFGVSYHRLLRDKELLSSRSADSPP